MRCLYCGKEIPSNASDQEKTVEWHRRCTKKFFDTEEFPLFDISETELEHLAVETVKKKYTVPGVQKKISLHLSKQAPTRLTVVDYPTGYILKPQTTEFEHLPEAEDACMKMAEAIGIRTVPHSLIKMKNETYAYITKRIDRHISYHKREEADVGLYAMEDFCQLSGRLTQDKYKSSYEKCAKIIWKYSKQPGIDATELFMRLIFSFVTGNSDMHLKNFSLIEDAPASRQFALSPAYDLLPVNVIMPEDTEQMALTLDGKKKGIHKKEFMHFAESSHISAKSAEKMIQRVIDAKEQYLLACEESHMSAMQKERMHALIQDRISILS
jgi:serine/threonine-protein kinase HipA